MPQVIKTAETKIISKNGECEISIKIEPIVIEINLNVNADGTFSVNSAKAKEEIKAQIEEEKVNWAVPDFGSLEKVKFGK